MYSTFYVTWANCELWVCLTTHHLLLATAVWWRPVSLLSRVVMTGITCVKTDDDVMTSMNYIMWDGYQHSMAGINCLWDGSQGCKNGYPLCRRRYQVINSVRVWINYVGRLNICGVVGCRSLCVNRLRMRMRKRRLINRWRKHVKRLESKIFIMYSYAAYSYSQ